MKEDAKKLTRVTPPRTKRTALDKTATEPVRKPRTRVKKEEVITPVESGVPASNITLEMELHPLGELTESIAQLGAPISGLPNPIDTLTKVQALNGKIQGSPEDIARFVAALQNSTIVSVNSHIFDPMKSDCDHKRKFVQREKYKDRYIGPSYKKASGIHGEVTGKLAKLAAKDSAQGGVPVNFNFYGSGIRGTIYTPTDAELLDLETAIAVDKRTIGASSAGLALTSNTYYTFKRVWGLFEANLDTNFESDVDLIDVLKITDLQTICWALSCSMYPDGYPFTSICVHDETKCNFSQDMKLILTRCEVFDTEMLTEKNKEILMSSKVTLADVQQYQNDLPFQNSSYVFEASGKKIEFTLDVPTIGKYFNQSERWLTKINSLADKIFEVESTDKKKYLEKSKMITFLSSLAHWVSKITINNTITISNEADISENLAEFSRNPEILKGLIDSVNQFIKDSTLTSYGLVSHDCPACGKPPRKEDLCGKHKDYIKLDFLTVFSLLVRTRLDMNF